MDIGPLVGHFPAFRHHFFGVSGKNGDLAAFGIQHCIAAEEGVPHLFFHMHGNFIEFVPHQAAVIDRCEIRPVHDCRYMVAGNAFPVGNAGSAVFIAAGIATVGVPVYMTDEDGEIRLIDHAVHPHGVAAFGKP